MNKIRKRRVFYVSGFDPRGAPAYHRMYVEESQKQAARSGISLQVGRRKREGVLGSTWRVERTDDDGVTVETTFEFMHWDDIARRHWQAGYARLYALAFRIYWYWTIASDSLRRVFRLSKWNFVTGVAPAIALLGLPALALLAAWGGYAAGRAIFPQAIWVPALPAAAGFVVVIAIGLLLDRVLGLGWLLRTYAFVVDCSLGRVPRLEERQFRFAERIASYVVTADDDEILIVGHSLGANVAVSTLARALAINPLLFRQYKPVGLLTLGGSIPLLGLLPWAKRFRDELALLAGTADLAWVDITAPQDIASFALLNPVTTSGVVLEGEAAQRPLVVSARFRELIAPESYERATWNVFRMHFQYLMASDNAALHDYLSVTTDSLSFRTRFSDSPETGSEQQGA